MEQEGIVSVWTGVFESDKALWDYAGYMDGTDLITPFSRDFLAEATAIRSTRISGNGACMNSQRTRKRWPARIPKARQSVRN